MQKTISSYISSLFSFLLISASLAIFSSCGGSTSGQEDSVAVFTGENILELTDTVKPVEKKKPTLHFSSAEEAITFMKNSGSWDRYEKGILPQMAKDALTYATKLLDNEHDGFLVVDKQTMKVVKFNKYGEELVSYGIACARNYGSKHFKRDNRTPDGYFTVKSIHDSTDWHFTDDDGYTSPRTGDFGPRFIRLDANGWSSIGIHGTCSPWSIGGRRSHGCIRVTNENIMKLVEMVEPGMPVIVSPALRDQTVNVAEGYEIPSVSIVPGKPAVRLSEEARKNAIANKEKYIYDPEKEMKKHGKTVVDSVAANNTKNVADTAASAPAGKPAPEQVKSEEVEKAEKLPVKTEPNDTIKR